MKKILITLFIILGTAFVLFGQCSFPRVGMGLGLSAVDTITLQSFTSPCPSCQVGGKYAWELDSAFSGMIFLNSDDQSEVTVRITKDCQKVLFDTCVSLPPMGIAGWAYYKEFIAEGNCQLQVFGLSGQLISLDVKSAPILGEALSTVILDMDTCGTLTALDPPTAGNSKGVLTTITGVPVGNNPPVGIYLNTYPDEAGKKPRLVRVLR